MPLLTKAYTGPPWRVIIAASCCHSTAYWPDEGEEGACDCGAMTWEGKGDGVLVFTSDRKGSLSIWEVP